MLFRSSRKLVAPLALVVFVWIFLLNAMDLLPVDLLPLIWEKIYGAAGHDPHHAYLRVVPTADLSVTMGLSVSVLVLCLIYNVKIKGVGGWVGFTDKYWGAVVAPEQTTAFEARYMALGGATKIYQADTVTRSEEHTSELQSH